MRREGLSPQAKTNPSTQRELPSVVQQGTD
jgi:hypothetical protein